MGPRAQILPVKDLAGMTTGNCNLVPQLDTLHRVPWLKTYRVGQFLCHTVWPKTDAIQASCTRNIACQQLDRLTEMGYSFLSAPELEFRVFDQDMQPVFDGKDLFCCPQYGDQQELHLEFSDMLMKAGVDVEGIKIEHSSGQFEFNIKPSFGITCSDQLFVMKDGLREMYRQKGYTTDFMSKYDYNLASNSVHLNHSLWCLNEKKNVFNDSNDEDNMSDLAKYWIGGLMKHSGALTFICSPTINCYRRLYTPYAPAYANWGLDDRHVTVRARSSSDKGCCIESRMPSGCCNFYLVTAATIAAGIDGIINKIEIPPEKDSRASYLPRTLTEALNEFENNDVIRNALGKTFSEWFISLKRLVDLKDLNDIKLDDPQNESDLKKERNMYKFI